MHRIVGRESVDLIKSGGYRIGAGEIETSLLGHPGVQEAAVVGLPDEDLGQRIVAFVVGSSELNTDELINYVAQELSVHKRPREVRLVDALPRNAMGKVAQEAVAVRGMRARSSVCRSEGRHTDRITNRSQHGLSAGALRDTQDIARFSDGRELTFAYLRFVGMQANTHRGGQLGMCRG